MKILHISDTHCHEHLLNIPDGIDMIIHSGDCSNFMSPALNQHEVLNFIEWFSGLNIKHKIFVPGNHDTSIEKRLVTPGFIASKGITYLENSFTQIERLTIWGTPITPTFGANGWAWNKARDKMYKVWDSIPVNTDIVISHGPPKGIMDLSVNRQNELEFCGCSNFKKKMLQLQPKLCLFGHIHNCGDIINAGVMKLSGYETIFSNGTVVTDQKFGTLSSQGNILEI